MDSLLPLGSGHSEIPQQLAPRIVDIEPTLGVKSMEFGGEVSDKVYKRISASDDDDKDQSQSGSKKSSDSDTSKGRGRKQKRASRKSRRPRGDRHGSELGELDLMSPPLPSAGTRQGELDSMSPPLPSAEAGQGEHDRMSHPSQRPEEISSNNDRAGAQQQAGAAGVDTAATSVLKGLLDALTAMAENSRKAGVSSSQVPRQVENAPKRWECPKGVRTPATFDPEQDNIEIFLERFETFVEDSGMPEEKQATALLELMSRPVYRQLHEARLTVKKNAAEIKRQLTSLYGSKRNEVDYQQDYFNLSQEEGESVRAFAIRSKYLVHKGKLNLEERFMATRFVAALRQSTWADSMRVKMLKKEMTMEEVVERAEFYEKAHGKRWESKNSNIAAAVTEVGAEQEMATDRQGVMDMLNEIKSAIHAGQNDSAVKAKEEEEMDQPTVAAVARYQVREGPRKQEMSAEVQALRARLAELEEKSRGRDWKSTEQTRQSNIQADVRPDRRQLRCYKCNELGHFAAACRAGKGRPTNVTSRQCTFCGEVSHWAVTCPRRNGEGVERGRLMIKNEEKSCEKCGERNHWTAECRRQPEQDYCKNCNSNTHRTVECRSRVQPSRLQIQQSGNENGSYASRKW